VFQDVEQVPTLDVEDDVLEPNTAIRPELRVFASTEAKYFTAISVARRVPKRHALASALVCPPVCPKAAEIRHPSPNPNYETNKKRA